MATAKIYGPYPHGEGFRCYLRSNGARVWCATGDTHEAAREHAEVELEDWRRHIGRTLGELCESYLGSLRAAGCKPISVSSAGVKLNLVLGPHADLPVASITERWAKTTYAELAGSGRAAARSHHEALMRCASCWAWAVEQGHVAVNPWVKVKPLGRANKGKEQLTIDEGRALMAVCLKHAGECDGALAILFAQLCGLRSMEILSRVVRDIDRGGTVIRVIDAKTKAGVRPVDIPDELLAAVRTRTAGRKATDPLFPEAAGNANRSGWLQRKLTNYCALAGVPRVVPHALRGQWATIAYQAGALSHLVARALGHTNSAITEQHYAKPEAVAGAKQAARLEILRGGKV